MPALDSCHSNVVKALEKDGWSVSPVPHAIRAPGRRYPLLADLRAERDSDTIIVVEIKCFMDDPLVELYGAIGQYLIYRNLLTQSSNPYPLYLAVPTYAYHGIVKEVGAGVIAETQMKVIVINIDNEVIEQWLN